MKLISVILLFLIVPNVSAQVEIFKGKTVEKCITKITKKRSSGNRIYRCEELFYKNGSLNWKLNFSYNGWQIIDSTYYCNNDSINYSKVYFATYEDSTSVPHYEFRYIDKRHKIKDRSFSNINDIYFLSESYLEDLDFLLRFNPIDESNEFKFRNPFIPSILIQEGIPYNEQLNSFSIELNKNKNLIMNDSFDFKNYTLRRSYYYQNNILKTVIFKFTNKKNGYSKEYSDLFIFH